MDNNMIILVLAGLVALGLIYRSVSRKPEKTTGGGSSPTTPTTPTQPDQADLMSLTRAQLVVMAEELGLMVPKSYTKSRIVKMILIESLDRNSTN
jgi:hypothetical protein